MSFLPCVHTAREVPPMREKMGTEPNCIGTYFSQIVSRIGRTSRSVHTRLDGYFSGGRDQINFRIRLSSMCGSNAFRWHNLHRATGEICVCIFVDFCHETQT